MLKHIVLLKLKPNTTQQSIDDFYSQVLDLKIKIPKIVSVSVGANNSPEVKDKKYTQGFVMEFNNQADREFYLKHPEHVKVAEQYIIPIIDDIIIFDYEYSN